MVGEWAGAKRGPRRPDQPRPRFVVRHPAHVRRVADDRARRRRALPRRRRRRAEVRRCPLVSFRQAGGSRVPVPFPSLAIRPRPRPGGRRRGGRLQCGWIVLTAAASVGQSPTVRRADPSSVVGTGRRRDADEAQSSASATSRASSSRSSTSPSRPATTPRPGLDVEFQNKIDPDLVTLVGRRHDRHRDRRRDERHAGGQQRHPDPLHRHDLRAVPQHPVRQEASSGITKAADLKGRKIGTPGRYGSGWVFLQALLGSAGLTVDDVEIVEYPDFTQAAAVTQGAVDAATGFSNNEPVQLERGGTPTVVLHVDDAVPLPGPGLIAGTKTIEAKHDAITAFVAATLRAMNEIKANPAVGLDAAIKDVPELAADRAGQAAVLAGDGRLVDRPAPGDARSRRDRRGGLDVVDPAVMNDLKLLKKPVATEELVQHRPAATGRLNTEPHGGRFPVRLRAGIGQIGYNRLLPAALRVPTSPEPRRSSSEQSPARSSPPPSSRSSTSSTSTNTRPRRSRARADGTAARRRWTVVAPSGRLTCSKSEARNGRIGRRIRALPVGPLTAGCARLLPAAPSCTTRRAWCSAAPRAMGPC